VLQILTRECPHATLSIPGLSEPASLHPSPGLKVMGRGARLPDGKPEEQSFPDGRQAIKRAQSGLPLEVRLPLEVEFRVSQVRPMTSAAWTQARVKDLGPIVWRWPHLQLITSDYRVLLHPGLITTVLVGVICFLVFGPASCLAFAPIAFLWVCDKIALFRCHRFGILLRGLFRTRRLHF
jgi:hypothetical protein